MIQILLLLTLLPMMSSYSLGQKDSELAQQGQSLRLEGIIRLVGNEPFTSLVLTDAAGVDWYISNNEKETILPFLQQQVTIEGTVKIQKQVLANGKELPDKKIIENIKVLDK